MAFKSYLPEDLNPVDLHQLIISSVAPRPIALVSTIDKNGKNNLAPFSFFNAVSSSPPILVFSANLQKGTTPEKHTLTNIKLNKECVINIVSYPMHRQMTLCSVSFEEGISEFDKSGLTAIASDLISPFRVKESIVQFECTVSNIIALGNKAGAANLIVCNIIKMHINKDIISKEKLRLDPISMNLVGRLGRNNYVHVNEKSIFSVYQPVLPVCIGYDALPVSIKSSPVLTANEVAAMAAVISIPTSSELQDFIKNENIPVGQISSEYHLLAKKYLKENKPRQALMCCLIKDNKTI